MSMSTRDQIRKAFNSKRSSLTSKWSQTTQVNLYALDIFLQKSGYRLVDVISHDSSVELLIDPIKGDSYLYPEITHDFTENVFYAEVKKYGELEASDLEGVIEGYQTALGVLKYLQEVKLDKLEIDREKN